MKLVLVCISLLLWQLAAVYCDNTKVILDKVKAGISSGKAILLALDDKQFSKNFYKIGSIAGKFTPFLEAVISLTSTFVPSPQMQLMRREFAKIDANFNKVFNKFGKLENLMRKNALSNQYHDPESNIMILSKRLHKVLSATTNESRLYYASKFKSSYEMLYNLDAEKLWNGMMYQGGVFAKNIPAEAMAYTNNHTRHTMNIMKSVLNVILQGVKVEQSYQNFTGTYHTNEVRDWDTKIEQIEDLIKYVNTKVKNRWYSQMKIDINSKLADYSGNSNRNFADRLYSFLTDKYYWRNWHVVAYNPISGGYNHWIKHCSGYHRFRTHGRNVAVASVDQIFNQTINKREVMKKLSSTSTYICHTMTWWGANPCYYRGAWEIYDDYLDSTFTSGCSYDSAGVIEKTADVQHRATPNHLVYVVNGNYVLYAFR